MNPWHRLHRWSWWVRWPLKLAAFGVVVVLVLYPKVWLLPRWVGRLHDMNATLQPDHPALGELAEMVHTAARDAPLSRRCALCSRWFTSASPTRGTGTFGA